MATKPFERREWEKIRTRLQAEPLQYGLPSRIYGSAVLGSFNIRKLGSIHSRDEQTWRFLADVSRHFDLLAVQEIMDDLSGLRHLQQLMGPEFEMIVSDRTGVFPGEPGLGERLGYIFNRSLIRRTELATDITYDRSKVLNTLWEYGEEIHSVLAPHAVQMRTYITQLREFRSGVISRRPTKPKVKVQLPTFLTFIRAPFCTSFEIAGHPGTQPYQFLAVNAHLYFGDFMSDRRQEFEALMNWLLGRLKDNDQAYYPNFILLGDLNLDFDNPATDRKVIEKHMKTFDGAFGDEAYVNFPFLDPHPTRRRVFRTNARLNQTFDQIGIFMRDLRLPKPDDNPQMGKHTRGPDYGVFNFAQLFSDALTGKNVGSLSQEQRKEFFARFEHSVSDHMPLWLRLPLP